MAWIDWYRSNAYIKIAQYRKDDKDFARENAIQLLNKLRSSIPSREYWPLLEDVYSNLESAYMITNEQELARQAVNEGLIRFPESPSLFNSKYFLQLASGNISNILELAKQAYNNSPKEGQSPYLLFNLSLAQMLTENPDFTKTAYEYLKTENEYCDYIRMMLYTVLLKEGNTTGAEKLLQKRWKDINTLTWQERLHNGDTKVWLEMLIGYYLGKVERDEIFGPLSNPEKFETHLFSKLDMPFTGMLCEGYFYDALLQGVKGDKNRQVELFNKVLETEQYDYYEYHMANYLLSKLKTEKGRIPVLKSKIIAIEK
jgi:lipoprotein NlpI